MSGPLGLEKRFALGSSEVGEFNNFMLVMPAQAGIQICLDLRLRGHDGKNFSIPQITKNF